MYRYFLPFILLFGFMALVIGCSEEATTSADPESIADEFGGFTPADESPGFGDPELVAEMTGDEEFDDPILSSPVVDSIINRVPCRAFAFRVVWGSLRYDSTVTQTTDWTGALHFSHGPIILRRLIKFEPGQDYILPRTDRHLIEWVSMTSVHHDGLLANVYIPLQPTASLAPDTEAVLIFNTTPLEIVFTPDQLASLDTVIFLEDSVNAVAFRSVEINPSLCPRGFLEGRWGRDSTGQGIFYGRWMSNDGFLMGHLRGYWGVETVDDVELTVFYGKYIDIDGKFQGLLRGVYHPYHGANYSNGNQESNRCLDGWFYGHFYDAAGNVKGVLKGHYMMPPARCVDCSNVGYFAGRWKTYCPYAVTDNDGFE